MVRDENSKVTFYADLDVKENLDLLDPGTKSSTINKLLRQGFATGATMSKKVEVLDAKIRRIEAASQEIPMYNSELHGFCFEFHTVEKTLQVAAIRNGEETTVKLEALRNEKTGRYKTRAYYEENFTLQPTYPKAHGKHTREPDDFVTWVPWVDFPWVDRETADAALWQALGFLRDRCDAGAPA